MHKPPSIRAIALQALDKWELGHVYAESLVANAASRHQLSKQDRNLLNSILVHTIRNLNLLDFWIAELRDGKLDKSTRNLLRLGLCQIHIIEIQAHAAVNETVNVSKKSTRGLVNAILRKSLREAKELEPKTLKQPLHIQYSHPKWLTDRWKNIFGDTNTKTLLEWNQQPSQTIFRLNPLKNEAHHILAEAENIESIPEYPDFFISKKLPPKSWIDDGLIYIQDPATSHAVDLLKPLPGETVLDACAAPGGKSTQIAAYMQNAGKLVCTDSNPKRLPRLSDNLSRMSVTCCSVEEWDWLKEPPERFHKHFNAILLDVPCSNTGVLRRRIDARWRLTSQNIQDLTKIQRKILDNASSCLQPGGRIVYSTCSIDPEENSELIKKFVQETPQFKLVEETQILPQESNTDGAYAALLELSK